MEAELLRDMIADRDKRIEKIKQKTEELRLRAVDVSSHLERVGADVTEQSTAFSTEKSELVLLKNSVVERLVQTQKDFKQQGVSLQTYSRDTVQDGNDASYVMRMQAQLCKAMHSLGITDHQMELVEKHSDSDVKFHKEVLAECTEERTATELELMNQLIVKDNERREFEAVFTTQLDKIAKEREALERQIEENGGDEDEEDEDENSEPEEEDPEEKEAKEELMKLLTERRAEIERLEQLQEEQDDLIAELEDEVNYDAPVQATSTTSRPTLADSNETADDVDDDDEDDNGDEEVDDDEKDDDEENDDEENDDEKKDEGKGEEEEDTENANENNLDLGEDEGDDAEENLRRTDEES